MKTILTIFGILYGLLSIGQNCFCEKDSLLNKIIPCDTIIFDNQTILFRSFDCDSLWITFENQKHEKEIIFSVDQKTIELTSRLGFVFAQEYNNTFLIEELNTGFSLPEFYLYDKTTGENIKSIGRILFYSKNRDFPFIVLFTNNDSDEPNITEEYNSLTIINLDNNKTHLFKLPKNDIKIALKNSGQTFPEF